MVKGGFYYKIHAGFFKPRAKFATMALVTKPDVRKEFLRLREAQPAAQKKKNDAKIIRTLMNMPVFCDVQEFFTYLAHRGEVSTDALIEHFLEKKKIIVPKIEKGKMRLVQLHDARFSQGTFGIREPDTFVLRDELTHIDVALIPGIAFDERGHRIGFGGGYFDRLLKKMRCTTIGLAYEFQIIDKVPTHRYDVPVDFIVTEKRIIQCNKVAP